MIKKTNSEFNKTLSYLLIGGGIGATLALLFAPKSGSELRKDISETAHNGVEKTRDAVHHLRENANVYYETAKDKANHLYQTAVAKTEQVADKIKALPENTESLIEEKAEQVSSAIDAGQKAYKQAKVGN